MTSENDPSLDVKMVNADDEEDIEYEEHVKASARYITEELADPTYKGEIRRLNRFIKAAGIPSFDQNSPLLDHQMTPILPFISSPLNVVAMVTPITCGKFYHAEYKGYPI